MNTFEEIYQRNRWNGINSRSGPGSEMLPTTRLRQFLPWLVKAEGIRSVLDVGCGDNYWMPDMPGYLGIDPSPTAIQRAQAAHPERTYTVGDVRELREPGETFDLVICRDVLQHLSLLSAMNVLKALRDKGRVVLISTYHGTTNRNVPDGGYYEPNLTAPPFGLRQPDLMLLDGWSYHDPELVRDPRKFMGLWLTP